MESKKEFILIKDHTDEELTFFLQKNLEEGWWLSATKGNAFIFQKKTVQAKRVCCLTVVAKDLGEGADEAVRREKENLQKKGWTAFLTGDLENLRDSQRHVFLYSEDPNVELPAVNELAQRRREKARTLRSISNLVISIIYAIFLSFTFGYYEKGSLLFLYGFVPALALIPTVVFSGVATLTSLKALKDPRWPLEKGQWRTVDLSTRLSSLTLLALVGYLVLDTLLRGF